MQRIGRQVDTKTCALRFVVGAGAGAGSAFEARGTAQTAAAAVLGIARDIYTAAGAVAGARRTGSAAARRAAYLIGRARAGASTAIGWIVLKIDTAIAARDSSRRAAALTVDAELAGVANARATAAVVRVAREVDAGSGANAETSVAAVFAGASRADLPQRAGIAAGSAMHRVAQGLDTIAGAPPHALGANTAGATASLAGLADRTAASAVVGVAGQSEAAAITLRQPVAAARAARSRIVDRRVVAADTAR